MKAAQLTDRGVIRLTGEDAGHFLNGLVTAEVEALPPAAARFAALLTPQGKIVCDFFVVAIPDGLLLDCPRQLTASLAQKLGFYKLRARVSVAIVSDDFDVVALWDGAPHSSGLDVVFADSRGDGIGHRALVRKEHLADALRGLGADQVAETDYEAHRIACGIAKGGADFQYGEAFPHEVNMDRSGGVDFTKGCYIGQEVVSRMQHRGTARTRVVPVSLTGEPPAPGTAVSAGTRPLGTMGSSAQGRGLAMLRLDRVADAAAAGEPIMAGDVRIEIDPALLQSADKRTLA
jgi:folate-binding protein YgfZ